MADTRRPLRVGLIGTGFMGKTHVAGFAAAARVFELPYAVEIVVVADRSEELAARAAAALGIPHSTGDWKTLVADDAIDVIDITAPNAFHGEMALAAIAAGKHVYCEKPLAPTYVEAKAMADAAEATGVKTQVGFNYLCNPLFKLAREMIAAGELGEIRSYRGVHAEDYMADASAPFSFRNDPIGGGVLADLGSHALATAEFLIGPIARVLGDAVTVVTSRPNANGGHRNVDTDDITRAFLRFESGASGSIEASWVAMGRKMQHDFEVYGTKGALVFSQERMNEMRYCNAADGARTGGFRRIDSGPAHPPYGNFCVAPAHHLGFNDLKAIEVAGFVEAIAGNSSEPYNFRAGARIQGLVETILSSARDGGWRDVA